VTSPLKALFWRSLLRAIPDRVQLPVGVDQHQIASLARFEPVFDK
jgi:hypothetical protein